MPAAEAEGYFQFGTVVGAHGRRGDLKVRPLTDGSMSLLEADTVRVRRSDGVEFEATPVVARPHKKQLLLRLEGFEGIEAAQELVGAEIWMPLADLPEAEAEESYWFELEGLQVYDRARGEIGILEEVFTTAAHDIFVVRGPAGETLIPAVDQFIVEVDSEAGTMRVDLPEGLVPDELEAL